MFRADLNINSAPFIEELYESWKSDSSSVSPEWQEYFARVQTEGVTSSGDVRSGLNGHVSNGEDRSKQGSVDRLIYAYREVGYLYANTNPLGAYLMPELRYLIKTIEGPYGSLSLQDFGLSEDDLDKVFDAGKNMNPPRGTLRQILTALKDIYCSTMGVEILHIQNKSMRGWLLEKLEHNNNAPDWTKEQKQTFAKDVIKAEEFEHFIHAHYIGQKRFSLEGAEVLIPALHFLLDRAAARTGIQEIVVGMAHRGRLNVLTNVLGKPALEIFSAFEENYKAHKFGGSGDVKYHIGFSIDHVHEDGSTIHVSLVANPSHLEAVDPVVEGKARGVQRRRGDTHRKKVIPVLIHGDSAFTGQGIVAETLNLSQLRGYKTGGTIHIIVNNQIGFTTASRDSRSTFFPTDVAKSMPVPIFHVNGNDPEQVVRAMDLALRFRHKFGYDVVVDIVCYRKYGHNETDEPAFTHPIMYNRIKNSPSVASLYCERLEQEGSMTKEEEKAFRLEYRNSLEADMEKSRKDPIEFLADAFQHGEWAGISREYDHKAVDTTVSEGTLQEIGEKICSVPEDMHINPKLRKIVETRRAVYADGKNIDWSSAEALCFGSLLLEKIPIRLSGEDSARGTFSQRHAVWWNVASSKPMPYTPLNHLAEEQARFSVYDSPLSEYSVLGFEYGNAMTQPHMLSLWEAQFGDFVNGAQVIIDNFIAAGESKWGRGNGLVMLLPHSFEGQGPEHSSAHFERFLQLCAEDNMQVCNLTTPAQYFHVLRRQLKRSFRKPLILMTPKSLLRHKGCVSSMSELSRDGFHEVLDDPEGMHSAETVVLCTGKVFYDFLDRRAGSGSKPAIVRMEQLYPFPEEQLSAVLGKYKKAKQFVWLQEEPRNRGAWTFISDRIGHCIGDAPISYVGRAASASPATGSHRQHVEELDRFMGEIFSAAVTEKVHH